MRCVVHHDHVPLGEISDGLARLATRLHQVDHEVLTRRMIGGELGREPTEVDDLDALGLGPLGQLAGTGGQADLQPVGDGDGTIVGVVVLGDLVLVHAHVHATGLERIDRLETPSGPARGDGSGLSARVRTSSTTKRGSSTPPDKKPERPRTSR